MATTSNTSSAPIQAQNSPRGRQSRRSSAARAMPSPPSPSNASPPSPPISGIIDQEQFLTSSSTTSSDSLPIKECNTVVVELGEDGLGSAAAGEDFQLENGEIGGGAKKPAWNKPSNGAAAEASVVMGAEAWPALGESARSSPKSSSTYSLKALSPHGSINVSQDMVVGSLSSPKEVCSPNSTSNHVVTSRPKRESVKHSGGSSSHHTPTIENLSEAPQVQHTSGHTSMADTPSHSTGKSGGSVGGSVGESPRDTTTNKDGGIQSGQRGGFYSGNESQPLRHFRRNNSGPLTRGDGSYYGSHGGRRDQERGKQDWGHRSFGSRDNHGPQQRTTTRPLLHGPSPNASFVAPSPVSVRPFVAPVVYTDMQFYVVGPHPDSLRPMSMVPMPSMFFSMHDPQLPTKILSQIDYYFSNENLVKDTFLRQNMDGEGWVSIKLIAGFKKVMQLTDNIQLILDAIKVSNVVEVQGDEVRRKGDWMKWIMSPVQTKVMSPQSINISSQNMLAAHLNNITLDEKAST